MERITRRQVALIGGMAILDTTLVSIPAQMIAVAGQDAWLGYLPAAVLVATTLWCLAKVSSRFPGRDLFQALSESSPFLGRLINLCFIAIAYLILIRDVRMMTDFVNLTLLPQTPLVVIAALIILPIALIARGGVEIVARMTQLFAPALLITLILMPIVILKETVGSLQPIFANGLVSVAQASWYAAPYLGEIIFIPFLFSGRTFRLREGLQGLALGMFFLLELIILNIVVLGPHLSGRAVYPNHEMIQQIRITDFLDRLDILIVGLYLPSMITKIAYGLHLVCHGLQQTVKGASARLLVLPVTAAALGSSQWFFSNGVEVLTFNRVWPLISLPVMLLPLLFPLLVRPRSQTKRGNPPTAT